MYGIVLVLCYVPGYVSHMCTPPNQKLGDIHEIPLVEGAEPVKKSIYRHSP